MSVSKKRGAVVARVLFLVVLGGASIARAEPPAAPVPAAPAAPPAATAAAPPRFAERHPDLQPPNPELETDGGKARLQQAREQFAAGAEALAAKNYQKCEEHYARAWVLQPSAGSASNLAQCENRLGYHVDAAEHLRDAQSRLKPEDLDEEALRRFADRAKAEQDIALSHIATLDVEDAPAGAVISLGPKLRFTAPIRRTIFLYPGDYVLELRTAEGVIYSAPLHVLAGKSYVRSVRTKARVAPAESASPQGRSVPLVIAGGLTAAAFVGLGVGLTAASHEKLSEVEALRGEIGTLFGAQTGACHAPSSALAGRCETLRQAAYDAGVLERVAITSVLVGGGVGMLTTAYALWPRAVGSPAPGAKKAGGARVVDAGVAITSGSLGVTVTGVW